MKHELSPFFYNVLQSHSYSCVHLLIAASHFKIKFFQGKRNPFKRVAKIKLMCNMEDKQPKSHINPSPQKAGVALQSLAYAGPPGHPLEMTYYFRKQASIKLLPPMSNFENKCLYKSLGILSKSGSSLLFGRN